MLTSSEIFTAIAIIRLVSRNPTALVCRHISYRSILLSSFTPPSPIPQSPRSRSFSLRPSFTVPSPPPPTLPLVRLPPWFSAEWSPPALFCRLTLLLPRTGANASSPRTARQCQSGLENNRVGGSDISPHHPAREPRDELRDEPRNERRNEL